MAKKTNPKPRHAYGADGDLPLSATPGDLFISPTTLRGRNGAGGWTVAEQAGAAAAALATAEAYTDAAVAVATDLAIYVSPTGNDANDGLTALTPLLTIGAAVRLAHKRRWSQSCVVNLAAGTYPAFNDANGNIMSLPRGGGLTCGPILFKGATADSGLGQLVATGGSGGAYVPTWQTVACADIGQPDNTFRGWFAVFDANTPTVALRGHVYMSNSLIKDVNCIYFNPFNLIGIYFIGATSFSAGTMSFGQLVYSEFDACTGSQGGATILVQINGTLALSYTKINNCTAPTASVRAGNSARVLNVSNVVGAGNAGTPFYVDGGGELLGFANNTLTGAVPGNDVSIDGNPAISNADMATLGSARSGATNGILQFGGGATASGGADTVYFGHALPGPTNNSAAALATPMPGNRRVLKLRVKPTQNNLDAVATFTLFKNGVATGITLTVPAGSTAVASDTTHTAVYADGDTYDLRMTATATVGRTIQFTATAEAA